MIQTKMGSVSGINRAGWAALLAVALGVAADLLVLRHGLTGAGFVCWMVLLLGAIHWLSHTGDQARLPSCWSVFALAAAFLLFYRSTPVLIPMMLLVFLSCGVNWLLQQRATKSRGITALDYPWTTLRIPVLFLQSLWHTAGDVDPSLVPRSKVRGVIKGLLLAIPMLMVFASLFAAADARFSAYLSSVSEIFSFMAVEHLITMTLMSVLTFGLLAMVLRTPDPGRINVSEKLSLGREETLIIMGSLVSLFLVFVVLQASYLFGGQDIIEQTSGLTLAEYARRGFFEMLVVAGLTLLVLLAMTGLRCDKRIFRPLAVVMVVLVLVIMISALQRLLMYVQAFGLTVDRLLALGVMLWLAGTLVGFVLTVLRGRPQGFAFGAVVSGMVLLLVAGAMNPAAIVAKTNIGRSVADADNPVDVNYLVGLGGDAVPVILAHYDELPERVQCQLGHALMGWLNMPAQTDWRQWNRSRAAALRAVDQNRDKLGAMSQKKFEELTDQLTGIMRRQGLPAMLFRGPVHVC